MATYYGSNATKREVNVPSQKAGNGEEGGVVRCLYDSFALSADLTTSDTIKMGFIPKGARVLDVHVAFDDLDASGGTMDIGWLASAVLDADGAAVVLADADGFINDADVTSADVIKMSDNLANGAGQFKSFDEAVQVSISFGADTDATSGNIKVSVYYIVD